MNRPNPDNRARCRITFGKTGVLRYTSHLDLARTWERVLRRAGVPLIYSQGFNPRPQIQLAAALPLGCESRAEVLDIFLESDVLPEPDELLSQIKRTLPEGLMVYSIKAVDYHAPALQTLRSTATYEVILGDDVSIRELQQRIDDLLAQLTILRRRRKKEYDLRPLIVHMEVHPGSPLVLQMQLVSSQQEGTGRPDEVLEALGLDSLDAKITRTNMTFEAEGETWQSVQLDSN